MIFDVGPLPPVGVRCRGRRILQNPLKNKHFERFGGPRGRRLVQNPLKNKHLKGLDAFVAVESFKIH